METKKKGEKEGGGRGEKEEHDQGRRVKKEEEESKKKNQQKSLVLTLYSLLTFQNKSMLLYFETRRVELNIPLSFKHDNIPSAWRR